MIKLYEGKAAIEKAIANVAKKPAALDKEQHKIALSAINHFKLHRDTSLIIKWAAGVHRAKNNVPQFVAALGIDPATGKVSERVEIDLTSIKPWHDKAWKAEAEDWDCDAAIERLIEKAKKHGVTLKIEKVIAMQDAA